MRTPCRSRLSRTLSVALALAGCTSAPPEPAATDAGADGGSATDAAPLDAADAPVIESEPLAPPPVVEEKRCPPEMVRVARRFCVDRYEAMLLDATTGSSLSPYYPPVRRQAASLEKTWQKLRFNMGDEEAQRIDLPLLPEWQRQRDFEPRAVSRKSVVPQGYTSGELAELACKNAGKRLCRLEEWRTACMGEQHQQFPYGPKYEAGRCNVFREGHPALTLHNDMTQGHSDPRLNQVKVKGKPLLRRTGETEACMSPWEGDAIADMVGNLDEWVADEPEPTPPTPPTPTERALPTDERLARTDARPRAKKGTFVGGFFSRSTRDGCMSTVTAHTFDYFDYSTGVRCCMDLPSR